MGYGHYTIILGMSIVSRHRIIVLFPKSTESLLQGRVHRHPDIALHDAASGPPSFRNAGATRRTVLAGSFNYAAMRVSTATSAPG